MIQEAFRDNAIRTPLKVDSPALTGAQEWNPASLKGREGISRSRGGRPLADHDGTGLGPGVKPGRVRGLAAGRSGIPLRSRGVRASVGPGVGGRWLTMTARGLAQE